MSDPIDPDAIRTRSFSVSRRGFERAEVESFQEEMAVLVGELQRRLAATDERLQQLGITELPDLKAEIDTVGEDVREILQAATDAAEDMRDRARADADAKVTEAQVEAESLRGEAWETSAQMLQQVEASAEELRATASEDVLFIRAEAEREALRMTGDARRDAEELARSSQEEADALLEKARTDGEAMIEAASQSADLAQERVRALEQRREELMAELETARETLTELEETIDGRRSELTHATTDPSESAVRVLTDVTKPDIGDWLDEDATVRLVPPPPAMPLGPVDADELVAEVASLREPAAPQPEPLTGGSGSSAEAASLDFEITSGDLPAVADASATAEVFADTTPEEASDLAATAAPPAESAPEPDAEPAGVTGTKATAEPEPEEEPAREPEPEPEEEPVTDSEEPGLADLFAKLRTSEDAPVSEASAAEVAPEPVTTEPDDEPAAEPAPAPTPAAAVGGSSAIEPRDLRDRMLVPITNEVLRGIKRVIVDVQNLVLEELRTESDEWRPKKAMFDPVLGDAAYDLAAQSYQAGISAAGEMADRQAPKLRVLPTHSLSGLITDLWEAVVDAISGTAGSTGRERGASVGRIFRAWRTDEAERRVRQVAHAEYNAGLVAGLNSLGIEHTMDPAGRDVADPDAIVIPVG